MVNDDDITPRVLLDHIQGMRQSFESRMSAMEKKMDRMKKDTKIVKNGLQGIAQNVTVLQIQVGNIGDAVDEIDILVRGQKHEERIVKLEEAVLT